MQKHQQPHSKQHDSSIEGTIIRAQQIKLYKQMILTKIPGPSVSWLICGSGWHGDWFKVGFWVNCTLSIHVMLTQIPGHVQSSWVSEGSRFKK